jgi:KDO2-lipid IV(A) lauroyltransferase
VKHRIEYLLLKAFLDFFASRTPEARVKWGRLLGRVWYRIDGKHRRQAEENIARAFNLGHSDAAAIARKNFEHIGLNAVEFAAFDRIEDLAANVRLEGLEHLNRAVAGGKGLFILSGHYGNWELGAVIISRAVPLTAVVRPMKNALSDELINERRRMGGLRVIGHRNSTRPILKKIGDGEAVGILLDQNTSHREAVFAPFLGRPASVNSGLAILAARTGAPVLPVYMSREEDLRHRVTIGPPIELVRMADRREETGVNSARFTAALEAHVRAFPEQWFWVHGRWKNQPRPGEKVYRA